MTYREIMAAVGLADVKAAEARVRRNKWDKRIREGTQTVEAFVPEGKLLPRGVFPAGRMPRHRNFWPQEMAQIITQYKDGTPVKALAEKHNCHVTTIYRILQSQKVSLSAANNQRPVRLEGESKQVYANRVQQWMRQNDPEWQARWKARNSAAQKRYWRKRRAKMEREAGNAVAPAPVPATVPMASPPPSFWQRYFGWLWS